MKNIISKYESDVLISLNDENTDFFNMAEDFVIRNSSADKAVMRTVYENGAKAIQACSYAGIVVFSNGIQFEIYPKVGDSIVYAKKILGRFMSAYLDIPFEASAASVLEKEEYSFMEFFISVFIRECMKIMKTGLLSGYTSIEENSTAMQGSIVFSENIRRNLSHRERLYVKHDVFTPDRAENRLIKTAASVMKKLTSDRKNEQELKKLIMALDEVKISSDVSADFSACTNTRNAKKYTTVLNICRMVLKKHGAGLSGRYVSNAFMYSLDELFSAYIVRKIRNENNGRIVRSYPGGKFISEKERLFPVRPLVAVSEKDNRVTEIVMAKWLRPRNISDIPTEDIFALTVCAKKYGCSNAVIYLPSNQEKDDEIINVELCGDFTITVKYAALASDTDAEDFYDEPSETEEYTEENEFSEEYEETAETEAVSEEDIHENSEENLTEAENTEETVQEDTPKAEKMPKKIKLLKKTKK